MKIISIKTNKIKVGKSNLTNILDKYLPELKENSVLVITSKIVSVCEGSVVKIGKADKLDLIKSEAEYYLPTEKNKHHSIITVKRSNLLTSAGIDKSNGNGYYILWPRDPQKSANKIRKYLVNKFKLKKVGVIISDSKKVPFRRGAIGFALVHSGFRAVNNYIGKPDIFGSPLRVTKANITDALAVAAVAVIGEGNEQTPLAIIEDIPFVKFQSRNPTKKELKELQISLEEDLYSPLLKSVKWLQSTKN